MEKHNIRCTARLCEHYGVNVFAGLLNESDDIVMTPLGSNIVDSYAASFLAPVELV